MTSPKVDSREEPLQAKVVKVKYRGLKDDFSLRALQTWAENYFFLNFFISKMRSLD